MSTHVEEPWTPEPELREPAPRGIVPTEFPDLNKPNLLLYTIVGIVLLIIGVVGLLQGLRVGETLYIVGGIVFALLGAAAIVAAPMQAARHAARAERLVREGMPTMARIVNSSNLTGTSTHGRVAAYMLTLPGGDVVRREVNVDERALPKRIPANVTALIDPTNLGDVELYCALPYRAAIAQAAAIPVAAAPAPTPSPTPTAATSMGTVEHKAPEPGVAAQPEATTPPQPKKSDYKGLPWE